MSRSDQQAGVSWVDDWTTIIQSEIAALAADPEVMEIIAAAARLVTQARPGTGAGATVGGQDGHEAGPAARAGAPPGAAAADDASGAGLDSVGGLGVVQRLEARVAELERRLDELARTPRRARRTARSD